MLALLRLKHEAKARGSYRLLMLLLACALGNGAFFRRVRVP